MYSPPVRVQDSLIINIPERKQPMSYIFQHSDSNQGKVACKTNTAVLMWSGLPREAQTYRDLPGVNLVDLGGGMGTLEIIRNEILIEF